MEKYKLKIGICDDNSYVCSEIEKSVLQYAGEKGHSIEVDIMQSGAELCELLDHTANAPQLLFWILSLAIPPELRLETVSGNRCGII